MKVTIRSAVQAYADYADSRGFAPSYKRIQIGYLDRFADCCDANARELGNRAPVKPGQLNARYVSRFFQTLPNTTGSHNRALTALRGFFKFCERFEYVDRGKTDMLLGDRKASKFTRQPKYYIPVSQFGPMTDAAGERHPVDRITFALALYTLGRQSEIAGLRLKDLGEVINTLRLYRPKRKRWTIVQVCPELADELYAWLQYYTLAMGYTGPTAIWRMTKDHPDWYLVPRLDCIRQRGSAGYYESKLTEYRLNPELPQLRLEKLVKRLLDIFGAQTEDGKWVRHKGEGLHTIRRSGARAMIDYLAGQWGEDKALLMVSTMLDHETTTMTLLYIGRSLEQKRLNAYLATGSMYGDHGRSSELPSNVIRMPLDGSESKSERRRALSHSQTRVGEVDAF